MSKILMIFYCEKEINKIFDYITKENKNSLILFDKNREKFYFKSNRTDIKTNIIIKYNQIIFNEDFCNIICRILKESFQYISKICPKEPAGPFIEPNIYSEIINYINLCSYDHNEPETVFDLVANLFYKYLTGHKMLNGNKRLSLFFLINILRYFGYHFYWSSGTKANYKFHQKKLEYWVKKSFNLKDFERDELLKSISKWIKSNCVIALQWRKKY